MDASENIVNSFFNIPSDIPDQLLEEKQDDLTESLKLISQSFIDFANLAIDNDIQYESEAVQYMIDLNPELEKDKIFKDLFPNVFMIELCKRKIKEKNEKFVIYL